MGLSFPVHSVDVAVGALRLDAGLLALPPLPPPAPLPPLLRTHSALHVSFSPGEAWTLGLKLPTVRLREPLISADSIHSLLDAIGKAWAHVMPPPLPTGLDDEKAAAEGDLDVQLLLQPSSLIDRSFSSLGSGCGSGARASADGSSGFELHVGAIELQLGVRPCPEWRSQLGLGDDGGGEAGGGGGVKAGDGFERAAEALEELTHRLPLAAEHADEGAGRAANAREEVAWLPAAALQLTLELTDEGPKPSGWALAFSPLSPARLHLEPSSLERLQIFSKHLSHLQNPHHSGGQPPNIAVSLPSLHVGLSTGAATTAAGQTARADGFMAASGAAAVEAVSDMTLHVSGVQLLLDAPIAGRLAGCPGDHPGPLAVRLIVDELSASLDQGNDALTTMLARRESTGDAASSGATSNYSSSSSALAVATADTSHAASLLHAPAVACIFRQHAEWSRCPSLSISIAPLRLLLTPELSHAVSLHVAAWAQLNAATNSPAGADAAAADAASTAPTAEALAEAAALETKGASSEDGEGIISTAPAKPPPPPLNLSLAFAPSELWLLLAPLATMEAAPTAEPSTREAPATIADVFATPAAPPPHAPPQRLGLCMGFAGSASALSTGYESNITDPAAESAESSFGMMRSPPAAARQQTVKSRKCVEYAASFDMLGAWVAPFAVGGSSPADAISPAAPSGNAMGGATGGVAQDAASADAPCADEEMAGAPLISAVSLHATTSVSEETLDSVPSKRVEASVELAQPLSVSLSSPQLRVVSDLVAQLSVPPTNPQAGGVEHGVSGGLAFSKKEAKAAKRAKRQAERLAAKEAEGAAIAPAASDVAASAPAAAAAVGASVLSEWLHAHALSGLTVKVVLARGVEVTLYGPLGAPLQPLLRACIPVVSAEGTLVGGAAALSHHSVQFSTAAELLTWSRAAHAWEPLLAQAAISFQAQQVRG